MKGSWQQVSPGAGERVCSDPGSLVQPPRMPGCFRGRRQHIWAVPPERIAPAGQLSSVPMFNHRGCASDWLAVAAGPGAGAVRHMPVEFEL